MKKIIALILIISVAATLSGCFGVQKSKSETNIYFKNAQTNELTIEKMKYSGSQNTVDMANFAMSKLVEGPQNASNAKTLPENVSVSSVTVKNEVANVDFSKEFAALTGIEEIVARFSVVRTLCDIPGISRVSITVNGAPLISNATGNEVGVLSKKDIVVDIDTENIDSTTETTIITLYFSTSDAMALKAETRKVETQNTISIEKRIVSELINGPSSPELSSVIPSGTKIISIETKDGVCYVNLSGEFISKFSGGTGMLTVYSIVNSLCSLGSIQSVQILIEGEKGAEFGNYVFDEPITPNLAIVQKQ